MIDREPYPVKPNNAPLIGERFGKLKGGYSWWLRRQKRRQAEQAAEAARPWPLWDALMKAARRWAEPFGVEVRRHHLSPKWVARLANEPRYCLDMVHGRLVHGGVEEAIATVSFSFADVRSPRFSEIFRRRMQAGIGSLLDFYAEGQRTWTKKGIKSRKRFWEKNARRSHRSAGNIRIEEIPEVGP